MGFRNQTVRRARNWAICLGTATILATVVSVAETHKDLRYTVAPGSSVFIVNQNGSITVHPSSSRQLQVAAVQKSDKVRLTPARPEIASQCVLTCCKRFLVTMPALIMTLLCLPAPASTSTLKTAPSRSTTYKET